MLTTFIQHITTDGLWRNKSAWQRWARQRLCMTKTGTTFYEIMCATTECEIGMREDITPRNGQPTAFRLCLLFLSFSRCLLCTRTSKKGGKLPGHFESQTGLPRASLKHIEHRNLTSATCRYVAVSPSRCHCQAHSQENAERLEENLARQHDS